MTPTHKRMMALLLPILVWSPSLVDAQVSKALTQFENLNSAKRYHFAMKKSFNSNEMQESKIIVQYLGNSRGENLHSFLFETFIGDAHYTMGYFQKIAGNRSFTYGYWNPSANDIDIDPERYIDLQGPVEVGTNWKFNVRYPGQPMVVDHPHELRYSFSASITQTGKPLKIGGFHFEDCIEVEHRGISDLEFTLTCSGKKIEHANVIQTITRTYCVGHGPVFEKAEQFLESDGKRNPDCNTYSYESFLTEIEDIAAYSNSTESN